MPIHKIIVGVDGSPAALNAVHWVAARASETNAEVVTVTALDIDTQFARDLPPSGLGNWRVELRRQLKEDWVRPLVKAGVSYRSTIVEASPATAIMEVADEENADLIVVGTHGHGGIGDRLLGSVTYRVTHLARHPVTVIPPDWVPPKD